MLGFPARSGCHNPLDYTAGDGSACCTYCVEDDTQNIKRTLLWDSTNGYAAQSETKRVVEKLALPFKQHIQQADNVGFCTFNYELGASGGGAGPAYVRDNMPAKFETLLLDTLCE